MLSSFIHSPTNFISPRSVGDTSPRPTLWATCSQLPGGTPPRKSGTFIMRTSTFKLLIALASTLLVAVTGAVRQQAPAG